MIEKLDTKEIEKDCGAFGKITVERKLATEIEMQDKINELVTAVNEQPQNWYAYLYINKSKVADASYFAHTQTGVISGILNYVATMTRDIDTEIKIVIKRKEEK